MGGGTWIYLGTFSFGIGKTNCKIVLSNQSAKEGRLVTADAVKIGAVTAILPEVSPKKELR